MENIRKFFTNKEKKLSKSDALKPGMIATVCLTFGVFCIIYYTIRLLVKKDLETKWGLALTIGIMLLGIVLVGLGVLMTVGACNEWQRYKMENGLYNHHLTMKDMEPILPQLIHLVEQRIKNCTIEESTIITENGLTNNTTE